MRNRPNTKGYRRDRRAKWNNPLLVWLFVFLTMLIMVPIQAAEDSHPEPQQTEQIQQAESAEETQDEIEQEQNQ